MRRTPMIVTPLQVSLRRLSRRLLVIGATAGAGWGLAVALAMLLAFAWVDLVWELSPEVRFAGWILAGLGGVAAIFASAWLAIGRRAPRFIAQRLDQAVLAGGEICSGVDLLFKQRPSSTLTQGLS